MAARLPVITTPAGDAGLVVQHDKTGYVVEGEDTQGMAAFMVQLARSPSIRLNFGETGRKRVEQEYNYESLAGRLVAIFNSFAAQQRRTFLLEMLKRGVPTSKTEVLSGALLLEGPAA
jgi:glycosyltransferase involved in cell wall biosynthesis